jgi:NAD+ synthase (glutamine-hydrolysing)
MKIAIAQLNPIIGDVPGNADKILAAAQAAADQGTRLMLTPELSLCGYPPRDLLLRPGFIDAMATTLEDLAQQLPEKLAVLVGFVERNPAAGDRGGKPLFNSMALLADGAVQQIFHKQLLPSYDVFDEDRYFEPGQQINHFLIDDAQGTPFTLASPFVRTCGTTSNFGASASTPTIPSRLWRTWGWR